MKTMNTFLGLCLVLLHSRRASAGVHEPDTWQPLQATDLIQGVQPSYPEVDFERFLDQGYHQQAASVNNGDQCELHKVGFTQDLYFQYILYKAEIPEMKEFTLCFWTKFTNHSNDHPIFSYAVDGQPKAIYSWVSNTDRSSYYSLAVEGHTFYRLNYPLRLNKWYHTCQSWNGKTGEWQIWVNAERVGRGFHNRLVGHTIPSGGIAITGQEQSQLGGGFQEGKGAPKGSGGMLGEITLLQLYNVALTAGKAHKDHKHHHAHKFDHSGNMITTPPPTTPSNRGALLAHPLLTGGQINRGVRINFAGQQPQTIQGQNYDVQFVNGQFTGNALSRQFNAASQAGAQQQILAAQVPLQDFQPQPITDQQVVPQVFSGQNSYSSQSFAMNDRQLVNTGFTHSLLGNPTNVQYLDGSQLDSHTLFKRGNEKDESTAAQGDAKFGDKVLNKREASKKQAKRELFIAGGTILEGSLGGSTVSFQQSLLDGLAGITHNQLVTEQQKESDEREPAEAEVKAVLSVCSGCDEEPFDKALVFGWRSVHKKLYSGAYFMPAVQSCRVF